MYVFVVCGFDVDQKGGLPCAVAPCIRWGFACAINLLHSKGGGSVAGCWDDGISKQRNPLFVAWLTVPACRFRIPEYMPTANRSASDRHNLAVPTLPPNRDSCCSASVGNRQGPLPKGVPDVVLHALSTYCKSKLGDSYLYTDLARALKDWEAT